MCGVMLYSSTDSLQLFSFFFHYTTQAQTFLKYHGSQLVIKMAHSEAGSQKHHWKHQRFVQHKDQTPNNGELQHCNHCSRCSRCSCRSQLDVGSGHCRGRRLLLDIDLHSHREAHRQRGFSHKFSLGVGTHVVDSRWLGSGCCGHDRLSGSHS